MDGAFPPATYLRAFIQAVNKIVGNPQYVEDYSPPEIPILHENPREMEKCNKTITMYIPPMKPKHALDNRYDFVLFSLYAI